MVEELCNMTSSRWPLQKEGVAGAVNPAAAVGAHLLLMLSALSAHNPWCENLKKTAPGQAKKRAARPLARFTKIPRLDREAPEPITPQKRNIQDPAEMALRACAIQEENLAKLATPQKGKALETCVQRPLALPKTASSTASWPRRRCASWRIFRHCSGWRNLIAIKVVEHISKSSRGMLAVGHDTGETDGPCSSLLA